MKRTLVTFVLTAMAVVAVSGPAGAADYYVAPTGDDTAAGTSAERPLKTIAAGAAKARAGDTVHIAPGNYVERVKISQSGAAGKPITLRRRGEGEVVWTTPPDEPKRFEDKYALSIEKQEYVEVVGLTFRDCLAWIGLFDSHHCVVRDCTFDGVKMYNAFRINSGSFNRILNCRFVRSVVMTSFREDAGWIPTPGCDYIEIFRNSNYNLVEGCTFGNITHTAVSVSAVDPKQFSPTGNMVRKNVFRDPFWKCLWFHAGKHNVFEDNLCTGSAANFVQLEGGASIIRRNRFVNYKDSTDGQPEVELRGVVRIQYDFAQHNRIYANLFYNNQRTITNNSYRWNVTDNLWQNNIFFANGQTVFLGFPDYATRNANPFIRNVMLQKTPGEKLIRLDKDVFTLKEAQEKLPELYRGNLEVDPKLVLKDGEATGLADGSPCIDAGEALTRTTSEGQGAAVPVADPLSFCDGNGMIPGDWIVIGSNAPTLLKEVNYEKKTLTVNRIITWKSGDAVNLKYAGKGPDIGPFEQ